MKFKITTTLADAQSGSWLRLTEQRHQARYILIPAGLFLIASVWRRFLCDHFDILSLFMVALAILVLLWYAVLFKMINQLRVRQFYQRNQSLFQEVEIELTAERLTLNADGLSNHVDWNKIIGYRQGKQNILIYYSRDEAINIPTRVFEPNQEQAFLQLLNERGLKAI